MSDSVRKEIGEGIALECRAECISTCGAIEYALEAAQTVEKRALERDHLGQREQAPIEVTCSGMRPRYHLFGRMICPQRMNVTIHADIPYAQAVDFRHSNSSRNQPDFEQ